MTRVNAIRRAAESFFEVGRWVAHSPVRWRLALQDVREARMASRERMRTKPPHPRERQEALIRFYDEYENLVDVLCDAAQYGPDSRLQDRYSTLRSWMQANYPPIRRFVAAFLAYDARDAARSLDLHGSGRDAFEALYAAGTLDEFLRSDDGQMIARIDRTRTALNRYGEHLRQLIAHERSA